MSTLTIGEEMRLERDRHLRRRKIAVWILNAIGAILGVSAAVLVAG
jgi:hypothetical protein